MTQHSAKKKYAPYVVKPTLYAACIEVSGGSATAGGLLYQMFCRSQKGTLKDENGLDGWLAISIEQWLVITGFTRHQYNDALAKLKKLGLIEFRRRRLSFRDPAALAWLRLPETVKSATAEIMKREPISAFPDKAKQSESMEAEITCAIISAEPDGLKEMSILEKENKKENVVIQKTTTDHQGSLLKSFRKKGMKKEVFENIIKVIFEGSPYTREPYKFQSAKRLGEMLEFLEANPGNYPADKFEHSVSIDALKDVVGLWNDFVCFAAEQTKAYNMPAQPKIWALHCQMTAIPEFTDYLAYLRGKDTLLSKTEEENYQFSFTLGDLGGFQAYLSSQSEEEKAMHVQSIIECHQIDIKQKLQQAQ